jgi:hypothetical protein
MKIIIKESQYRFLCENFNSITKKEFKELSTLPGKNSKILNKEYKLDEDSVNVEWKNELKIDDYNDIGYQMRYDDTLNVVLYNNNNYVILEIDLNPFLDGYTISYTRGTRMTSGKRIGARTYLRFVDVFKMPIYSDNVQTVESRYGIWYKLFEMAPNRIFAFETEESKSYPIFLNDNNEMCYYKNGSLRYVYDKNKDIVILKLIP